MLTLFYSNRYDALSEALLARLDQALAAPGDPFAPIDIIVPSRAVARRLELDMASRFGICANVRFCFLAEWLWRQIGQIMPVAERSPFSADSLTWHAFEVFSQPEIRGVSSRLDGYLDAADDAMRHGLAKRVAGVFDQYITYRPDWLEAWRQGRSIFAEGQQSIELGWPRIAGASSAHRDDERWQSALWRTLLTRLSSDLSSDKDSELLAPVAYRFVEQARTLDLDAVARAGWPQRIDVFALPTMAPLHVALLRELARWIDVRIYAINPCREFWFDIVTERRASRLELEEQIDFHEVGNPLLAEWGRQTQAHLSTLHDMTSGSTQAEASYYERNADSSWLAAVQNAVLDLQPLASADASPDESEDAAADEAAPPLEAGLEVHVCHSLTRQLEVLQDRLLSLLGTRPDLDAADIMIALPDLAGAAPLIDAVFGTVADARRLPYRITGLPSSKINPVAKLLLALLALPEQPPGAGDLIEWLGVSALAERYGIDAADLDTLRVWFANAGARSGFASDEEVMPGVPPHRHTFADALSRLYLGYAMPDAAEPVADILPVPGAAGSEGQLLGRLTRLVDDLESFSRHFSVPMRGDDWQQMLDAALDTLFLSSPLHADAIAEVRDACAALAQVIRGAATDTLLSAAVMREALTGWLDDPARGGVPSGGVTFCALASLRQLPFKVVCIAGLDDGALPAIVRADEFDLIAAFGRHGDRQRRDDERNLFLDLFLAAQAHLLITYTGRSIRDNAPLPPSALVDELLDHFARAVAAANQDTSPDGLKAARGSFVIEHPLQSFSTDYLATEGDSSESGMPAERLPGLAAASLFPPRPALSTFDAGRADIANAFATSVSARQTPFFRHALPPLTDDVVTVEAFLRFWSHPIRTLLRERLGITLMDDAEALASRAPFELDYAGRDALTERVLPALLTPPEFPRAGLSGPAGRLDRARRIAAASPEVPGGATGAVIREREVSSLMSLASRVWQATATPLDDCAFAFEVVPRWPLAWSAGHADAGVGVLARGALLAARDEGLTGQRGTLDDARGPGEGTGHVAPMLIEGVFRHLTPAGMVLFRRARPGGRDHLKAWLWHLLLCAAPAHQLPPDMPRRTIWLGETDGFAFRPVEQAPARLAELLALYRVGHRWPLRFFPKSAWSRVSESAAAAQRVYEGGHDIAGEGEDRYLRIALRGLPSGLDAEFEALSELVMGPLREHLVAYLEPMGTAS